MKKLLYTLSLAALALAASPAARAQSVGIGTGATAPDASAALEVKSTTKGLLIPRMTAAQRTAIATTPPTGLMVYQTDGTAGFYYYNGTAWVAVSSPAVPAGGATGQVLSKNSGTDYDTRWLTPSSSSTFPSIELSTSVTSAQNMPNLAGSNTYTPLIFSSSNGTGAALTGGNTWNGSVFTVGSTGTGTYQITVHMTPAPPSNLGVHFFLDKNNAIGNATSTTAPYALSTYNLNASGGNLRFNSTISTVIYLAAGDQITFRAQSISTSTTSNTNPDGSNNIQIVRLK